MPITKPRLSDRKELIKMFRKIAISAVSALVLATGAAQAAGGEGHVHDTAFSFEGPFGKFDQNQLQRGLQVYTEVCSACHGLKYVPIRTLADEGGPHLPADQVRAYAASLDSVVLPDGTERPREWTDKFPTREGEGMGPDLSLMAKARAGFHGPYGTGLSQLFQGIGGPEYIVSLLTGYDGQEKEEAGSFFYGNTAFPGGWISMTPPLSDGQVEYADGHDNSAHHMAEDVAAFLMWTAEPKMMDRKQTGFVSVLFLVILSSLLYLTNKRLWAGVKGKKKHG
jgi:ubiquinol-cytochrome c reductase cytochrome c1 subunit